MRQRQNNLKRSPTKDTNVLFYNNEKIEIVHDFNYLGVIFNFTSSFTLYNQYVIGKALRASVVLLSNLYNVEVNPKMALEHFDTLLGLFCHTAVKLWFTKCKGIEQIQLYFLQIIVWCKKFNMFNCSIL